MPLAIRMPLAVCTNSLTLAVHTNSLTIAVCTNSLMLKVCTNSLMLAVHTTKPRVHRGNGVQAGVDVGIHRGDSVSVVDSSNSADRVRVVDSSVVDQAVGVEEGISLSL